MEVTNPYVGPVADLVDPYLTYETKHSGRYKSITPAGNLAVWWLRRNPGRWALVAEGTTGMTRQLLLAFPDIDVTESRKFDQNPDGIARTYARVRHPEGETLNMALQRRRVNEPALYLPKVTRDEFNWTKEELADACEVARANLFPTGAP